MQITPKDGPTILNPGNGQAQPAQTARERAIAALMKGAPEPQASHPVPNPSQVSPEEMGAIRTPSKASPSPDNGQNATNAESATPSSEAPKESEDSLSAHYANLARKEKALRAQAQRLQAEREAFKKQQEELAASKRPETPPTSSLDPSKYVSREDLLNDPFSVLSELGLTYDKLTESALKQPSPEEMARRAYEKKLEAKLTEIEEAQKKAAKDAADREAQTYQQAIAQIRNDTKDLVDSNPDAYEAIRSTKSINDVVELIERTFNEGLNDKYPKGSVLPVDVAANMVEEYLVEEASKLARLKKIQQRLKPAASDVKPEASPKSQSAAPTSQAAPLKTLTNSVSTSRPLNARERALLAFEGKLNK